jgi:NAD(P)H-hydrate epimerase
MKNGLFAAAGQMKHLDEIAVASGLEIRQMMELAAFHVSQFCIDRFQGKSVGVFAGSGNNGADAIASARFLHNAGFTVEIVLLEDTVSVDGQHHLELCRRLDLPIRQYGEELPNYDVIIDGLIGYSLDGKPRGRYADCINYFNNSESIIISVDIPSGFDTESGKALEPCVQADATLFLAYAKKGFDSEKYRGYFGSGFLIDIGIPPEVYQKAKLPYPF